jgi:FkbM family methyltransferase
VPFEPERGNLQILRRNLAEYGDQAAVIEAAVGGRERRVSLTTEHGEFGFRMVDLDPVRENGDVDVVIMETILAGAAPTIDILKCDIEGAETEVFASCADWLPRVRLASVECHYPFTWQALVEMLRENGAEPDVLAVESNPRFGYDSVVFKPAAAVAGESDRALT